jgi:hypothetical protein
MLTCHAPPPKAKRDLRGIKRLFLPFFQDPTFWQEFEGLWIFYFVMQHRPDTHQHHPIKQITDDCIHTIDLGALQSPPE